MMQHLNVWVRGDIMVSVPLKTDKQKEAAGKVSQGLRDGEVVIFLESKAR